MKNLVTFLFTFIFLGIGVSQAQGNYVLGAVNNPDGTPVANAYGIIEYDDCNNIVTDTVLTDPNGYYNYTFLPNCTQGSIIVTFYCPTTGNSASGQGAYFPGQQTVAIDIILDCSSGTGGNDSCFMNMTYIPGDFAPSWLFIADAGVLPANTTYTWNLSGGATLVNPNAANSQQVDVQFPNPGVYTICADVMDLTTQDILCGDCLTITYPDSTNNNCTATFYQQDSLGFPILDGYVTGGSGPYTYQWTVGQQVLGTSQYIDLSNFQDGTYYVCFMAIDANGMTCEYCEDVVIGGSNTCSAGFYQSQTPIGTGYQAWAQGASNNYTYTWLVSDPSTTLTFSGSYLDETNIGSGTYYVCLTAYGDNNDVCDYCETITIGNQNNPCWVGINYNTDPNGLAYLESVVQGGTAPFTYLWSDGSTGANVDLANLPDGTYTYCVTVTDSNGVTCDACYTVTIGNNGVCLDWSVIDLANAPCTSDYNPVCGCDGIEYTNACIAYYCFGVLDWTNGPCNYTGGGVGSGGNTGGTPIDTTCQTTSEFFYYGNVNPTGGFDLFFFGFGVGADEFYWDMGDGSTYAGDIVNHTYNPNTQDSIQAYTVCLTTLSYADSCTATVCETIVLDDTPNGYIGGQIADGGGIGGDGQVERVMNAEGDPLVDVTVELKDPTGAIIASTTTDVNGEYSFSGLQFGDYFVYVNIDGVNHTPDLVQLRPYIQGVGDNDYEVVGNDVLSGIDGVSFASGINIAPNPTIADLVVSLELHANADINITVMDVLGKTVRQESNSYTQGTQNIELSLEGLASGIYMVSLQANGEIFTAKVLKQ